MRTVQKWFTHLLTRHNCVILESELSVLDFILQLWRKLKTDCTLEFGGFREEVHVVSRSNNSLKDLQFLA